MLEEILYGIINFPTDSSIREAIEEYEESVNPYVN